VIRIDRGVRCLAMVALTGLLAGACRKQASPAAETVAAKPSEDTTLGVPAPDSAAQLAARFVQGFYDWYQRAGERYDVAVQDSPAFFAPALLSAMRTGGATRAGKAAVMTGLDRDPFLATRDPCDPYQVTGTSRRGDTILVAVNGMCSDRPLQVQPDVIAEVRLVAGRWAFVDFRHVDDAGSLVQDLARLRGASVSDSGRAGRDSGGIRSGARH